MTSARALVASPSGPGGGMLAVLDEPTLFGVSERPSDPRLPNRLRWLIALRLIVITTVMLPDLLLQLSTSRTGLLFDNLYGLAGFTYAASLIYIALLRFAPGQLQLQAYVQFAGDLLLVTGLVYQFGGVASPFSPLYLIVISVSATILPRTAGVAIAQLAWLLYAATVLSLHGGWISAPRGFDPTTTTALRLSYGLAVHLFGFNAVALLVSYMARRVQSTQMELEVERDNLAQLELFHRDVIESMSSGLVTTDRNSRVTSANRAALRIVGRTESELVGRPIYDLGFFDESRWNELCRQSREQGKIRDEATAGSGEERQLIGFSVSELQHSSGLQIGHTLIFQDLTQWRQLRDQVRMKDRMAAVGELAAGIAHEIGNPLAAISGSVQMLSQSAEVSGSSQKLLDITLAESRRLDRTIKSFLEYARPADRRESLYDIGDLLERNFSLLRNSEEVGEQHTLELDLDPPSFELRGDPDQVTQVFWNLTKNAIRAMPDGGSLKIVGRARGDLYEMRYCDTGRGMSESERANLFHPFKTFFDGGLGIGMAIVYRVVEEHGGRISVESEPHAGTEIVVELPVLEEPILQLAQGA